MPLIVAARRSAVMPKGGQFAHLEPHDLVTPVLKACLADVDLAPSDVDELILSNALGGGGNPARLAALAAGLPDRVAGLSIDRQCAGGLDAILLGHALVAAGVHDVVVAGGVESYSRRPLRARTFADGRTPEPYDQARFTPWASKDPDMAEAADQLGHRLAIGRAEQDQWAQQSHAKARRHGADRQAEIVPVGGVTDDAFLRDLTPRICARAPVVTGSITAANMAVAADAAACVVIVSDRRARNLNRAGLRLLQGATRGSDPLQPGLAPLVAIKEVLAREGIDPYALHRSEIMEAFAVQALACIKGAQLRPDSVNPAGGALAQGHPVGASGAILAVKLFHGLQPDDGPALAAIAAAGGLGSAALFKAVRAAN
ncbi:acetyl-CoA C-acyltransferase [Tritonibacter horizontis]|uniref:Putative acetyl-CoA C-acetyltransferase YhfS n=1 Tax=Tritonibacter horizontis TaxID=1768241 RepID=A0A132C335_9RHOB|nr:acetyl-CoA C-acyltransferase [Tritonibacter horizontis]KUP94984.1 putative acetyl-CoA C-acetyltransferase YhfS [Tritonibacter horizontis]